MSNSYKIAPAPPRNFDGMFRQWNLYQMAAMTFVTGTYNAPGSKAVLNPTESAQTLSLKIQGALPCGKGTLRRIAPQSLTAMVVTGQDPGIKLEEQLLSELSVNPTFASFSVNIYEFTVK